jgi:hypothetical protein
MHEQSLNIFLYFTIQPGKAAAKNAISTCCTMILYFLNRVQLYLLYHCHRVVGGITGIHLVAEHTAVPATKVRYEEWYCYICFWHSTPYCLIAHFGKFF